MIWPCRLGRSYRAFYKVRIAVFIIIPDKYARWKIYTYIGVIRMLVWGAPAAMPGSIANHVVWTLAVLPIYAIGSAITPPVPAFFSLVVSTGPGPGIHRTCPIVLKC